MKRKSVAAVVTAAAMMMSLAACGSSAADSTPAASESTASSEAASGEAAPAESEVAADFDTDQDITVISREDGSGTRGAFILSLIHIFHCAERRNRLRAVVRAGRGNRSREE